MIHFNRKFKSPLQALEGDLRKVLHLPVSMLCTGDRKRLVAQLHRKAAQDLPVVAHSSQRQGHSSPEACWRATLGRVHVAVGCVACSAHARGRAALRAVLHPAVPCISAVWTSAGTSGHLRPGLRAHAGFVLCTHKVYGQWWF